MNPELAQSISRMEAALGQLEGAVTRHFDVDARRSDIETELGVMQDDRGRLAAELESATARLARVEAASEHVGRRVGLAIGSIRDVLARSDGAAEAGSAAQGPA